MRRLEDNARHGKEHGIPMKTASQPLIAGRMDGAHLGVFSRVIHPVLHMPLAAGEARPRAKRQVLSHLLFTLARLAPAMLWLGNYGWNR